ncbi:MAG: C39 family peptidase [Clostridiales bacterium]|nr:C39 family peptidase [Clostridiales bacterium]
MDQVQEQSQTESNTWEQVQEPGPEQTEETPYTPPVRRHRRRQRRKTPWARVELIFFGIAALLALVMTVTEAVHVVHLISSAVETGGASDADDGEASGTEDETLTDVTEAEEESDPKDDPEVAQYADDTGYGGQLYALLDDYPETATVLKNLSVYPENILSFVVRYPEAMPFAVNYLDYLAGNTETAIDLSAEGSSTSFPSLIQWDERWGYESYGDGVIGTSGCGPTALSMVSLYLTGWNDNDPASIASYAQENGYYVSGYGSSWTLMSEACGQFGLKATELTLDENQVIQALEEGHPVICSVGEGVFTDNGHYIVIYAYNEADGTLSIRDPNSPTNSARSWSFSDFSDQINNLWSFEAIAS